MKVTARKSATKAKGSPDAASQVDAMKARAAATGTQLHGVLLEALRGLDGGELTRAQQRVCRNAYIVVACAALRTLVDLATVGGIKFATPDVPELLGLARKGLQTEVEGGPDNLNWAFLMLDWLGEDRFAYIMNFYAAAEALGRADKAKAKADGAIENLKGIAHRAGAGAPASALV